MSTQSEKQVDSKKKKTINKDTKEVKNIKEDNTKKEDKEIKNIKEEKKEEKKDDKPKVERKTKPRVKKPKVEDDDATMVEETNKNGKKIRFFKILGEEAGDNKSLKGRFKGVKPKQAGSKA